jgi:WD40 repeat protein
MVTAVTFSPDGTRLASASHDGTVRVWVWEAATEVMVATLSGHAGEVTAVAFSPDGARLITDRGDIELSPGNDLLAQADVEHSSVELLSSRDLPNAGQQLRMEHVFSVEDDKEWICFKSQRLLWLPVEFRGTCRAMHGQQFAIVTKAHRVVTFSFDVKHLHAA